MRELEEENDVGDETCPDGFCRHWSCNSDCNRYCVRCRARCPDCECGWLEPGDEIITSPFT